jgi:hypothetical protein
MIVPDGSDKEENSASVDYSGMIKVATAIVIGLLTIVGFGWDDLTGSKSNTKKRQKLKKMLMSMKTFIWTKKLKKMKSLKKSF